MSPSTPWQTNSPIPAPLRNGTIACLVQARGPSGPSPLPFPHNQASQCSVQWALPPTGALILSGICISMPSLGGEPPSFLSWAPGVVEAPRGSSPAPGWWVFSYPASPLLPACTLHIPVCLSSHPSRTLPTAVALYLPFLQPGTLVPMALH